MVALSRNLRKSTKGDSNRNPEDEVLIQQLTEQVEQLKSQLREQDEKSQRKLVQEETAHLDALRQLRELRERYEEIDNEAIRAREREVLERDIAKRRESLEWDLAERRKQLEREYEKRRRELEDETKEAQRKQREQLESARRDLETYRDETRRVVRGKVESFGDNYNYYLHQLKLMMDLLSETALEVGETFLDEGAPETEELFQRRMGDFVEPETVLGLDVPDMSAIGDGSAAAEDELVGADDTAAEETQISEMEALEPESTEEPEQETVPFDDDIEDADEDAILDGEIERLRVELDRHAESLDAGDRGGSSDGSLGVSDATSAIVSSQSDVNHKSANGDVASLATAQADSEDAASNNKEPAKAEKKGTRRNRTKLVGDGVTSVLSVVSAGLLAAIFSLLIWVVWLMLSEEMAFTAALRTIAGTVGGWFGGLS